MKTYRLSSKKMTVLVNTDGRDVICEGAPVVKKFIGSHLSQLIHWMRRHGSFSYQRLK